MAGDTPLLRGGEPARLRRGRTTPRGRAVSVLTGDGGRPVRLRPDRSATTTGDVDGDRRGEGRHRRAGARSARSTAGILAFDAAFLADALPRIGNDNAKGEYYLTDVVGARPRGRPARSARSPHRRRDADRGRQRPRPARRARPRAEPPDPRRAGCATASRHGPGDHLDRRRRGARARRHDPARRPAARRDRGRRGRRDRAGQHAQGLRDRRRRARSCAPTASSR